ncbi:VOC family protein [Dongia deserti]|uniref:VOC family protein n=1 Tax=Dongia deserti TaxID=2268030 RepID=UPI002549703E|nr:VOC family protein [Dongia deserti]
MTRRGRKPATRSKPPFVLEGIDHILLLVKGMKPAVRFYTSVLGCKIEGRLPQYGMLQLRAGSALIDLVDISDERAAWAVPPVAGGRNFDHLCLALGAHDEAKLRRHLARHRVDIIEERAHGGSRGESLSFYVRDPSGNVIELKGPPAS